jgi:hypothetical protein
MGRRPAGSSMARTKFRPTPSLCRASRHPLNCHILMSQLHTHLPTHSEAHSSSWLERGPDADRATPKIPAAQLHTSSHSPPPPSHLNTHSRLYPSPMATTAPCGDPPSALRSRRLQSCCWLSKTPPHTPRRRHLWVEGGGWRPRGVGYCWVPFRGLAPGIFCATRRAGVSTAVFSKIPSTGEQRYHSYD